MTKFSPKPATTLMLVTTGLSAAVGAYLLFSNIGLSSLIGFGGPSVAETQTSELPSAGSAEGRVDQIERMSLQLQRGEGTDTGQVEQPPENTAGAQTLPQSQLSEADQQLIDDMRERIAREDAERAERMRQAARSPIGESIYTIEGLLQARRNREAQAAQAAEEERAAAVAAAAAQTTVPQEPTYALRKGTVIAASLLGEIRSELPGLVRAMITLDVYDSVTGHQILIPRGSQLIGRYDNQTQAGQERLFIFWDEVQLANGGSIDLNNAATVDAAGASGVTGRRNGNFLTTLLGATLLNLAQNAGQTQAASDASDLAAAARIATGQAGATVTEQYLNQRLSRGTRFTIPAGTVLNVMLDQDIELPSQGRF